MAEIAKSGTPSISSILVPQQFRLSGLVAGEAIAAGDACYIANTGKVMRSSGAAANAAAKVRGYAAMAAASGEAVTLVREATFAYGSGLTPGADLYLSGTVAGGLADAASVGGTAPIGYALDATRVVLYASRY